MTDKLRLDVMAQAYGSQGSNNARLSRVAAVLSFEWSDRAGIYSRERNMLAGVTAHFEPCARKTKNVKYVTALCLDFDHNYTIEYTGLMGLGLVLRPTAHDQKSHRIDTIISGCTAIQSQRHARRVLQNLGIGGQEVWTQVNIRHARMRVGFGTSRARLARNQSSFWSNGKGHDWTSMNGCHKRRPNLNRHPKRNAPSRTAKVMGRQPTRAAVSWLRRSRRAVGWADQIDADRVEAECPWKSEHTAGKGDASSTVIFSAKTGHEMGLFKCSHAHCANRTNDDALSAFVQSERVRRRAKRLRFATVPPRAS